MNDFDGLSTRAINAINRMGVKSVFDLSCRTKEEVLSYGKIGKKTVEELESLLHQHGEVWLDRYSPSGEDRRDIQKLSDIRTALNVAIGALQNIELYLSSIEFDKSGRIIEGSEAGMS